MKKTEHIVITGGSRGIGLALAAEFLRSGCRVMISGRSADHLRTAADQLQSPPDGLFTRVCDASRADEVEGLWQEAVARLGTVDIWINNAGVGQDSQPVWEVPAGTVQAIVDTNIAGLIFGCQTAFRGLRAQGSGRIFNMEGFGSDGRHMNNLTVYGTSKSAVRYLTDGLAREAAGSGVLVGALSPGMVATDFLLVPLRRDPERLKRGLRILNILADHPETVARFLVPRILSCRRQNARIAWLTGRKILWRFLTAAFSRRKIITS
jgi:NAD(P)-dependent dehydrogenase (short-subunit alcohol dehydrogenase family)